MDVNRFTVDYDATDYRIAVQRPFSPEGACRERSIGGYDSKTGGSNQHVNTGISRPANSGSILRNGIQHRLNVGRRAGDHAKNLACRGLLLQRLGEFLEQPHVLNRNDGVVGEGFEQLDLRWGEGAHFDATRGQHSNDFSLLTQGNQQVGTRLAADTQHWEIVLRPGVRDMERAMLDYPVKSWFINTDHFAGKTYGYRTEPRPRNEIAPVAKSQP